MFTVLETAAFSTWFSRLRDAHAKARIHWRLDALRLGRFGDVRFLGGGLGELRIDVGPGYRIYFVRRAATVFLLLSGGDKSSQARDIARARSMAADLD